ncbi:hypothetical protein LCGC14_2877960, partial [marine sediment metagenome]
LITPQNQVGTDVDFLNSYPDFSPVRTVPTPSGDIAYIRKFGTDYLIKQVTAVTATGDVNMIFTVKAADGTILYVKGKIIDTVNGVRAITDYTISGTDVNLTSPMDLYDTATNFKPCAALDAGDYYCYLYIGNEAWAHFVTNDVGNNVVFGGQNNGTPYGDVRFASGGINWSNFATAGNNGFKTMTFPKNADDDSLGGSIQYYYNSAAWTTAFNGNMDDIYIAQNGSVYKGNNVGTDASLVVRWDGFVGAAGGGGTSNPGETLVTAQPCYLEIAASGGVVTVLASITITTDIDGGGLAFTCVAESFIDGNILTLYLSDTGVFSIKGNTVVDETTTNYVTLTDNSIANNLHRHSELVASDGSPDPALSVNATGEVGIGTNAQDRPLEIRSSS